MVWHKFYQVTSTAVYRPLKLHATWYDPQLQASGSDVMIVFKEQMEEISEEHKAMYFIYYLQGFTFPCDYCASSFGLQS